jgi:signal transduction histidine kinase
VLSNAYKYSPDGGAVDIGLIESSGDGDVPPRIGIRITDHGIGMTPEQLARVCERFYRADTSGKIPGTGLGMSIVKEIVELHGGELEISSEVGTGSTVTIWLPGARDLRPPAQVPC